MIDRDSFIAARKAAKLSQIALAEKAGVSQQLIGSIETGRTKTSKYLPRLATALRVTLASLDPDYRADGMHAAATEPQPPISGARDLPVYASAEGGGGVLVMSSDPVDFVKRPAPLAQVKDGYALIVVGDSMYPEFKPGDEALVHPHLPPVRDEACVFQSDDGNGTMHVTIKVFVRATSTHWHVKQHNPPREFTLSRKEWQRAHRVVGKYSRR